MFIAWEGLLREGEWKFGNNCCNALSLTFQEYPNGRWRESVKCWSFTFTYDMWDWKDVPIFHGWKAFISFKVHGYIQSIHQISDSRSDKVSLFIAAPPRRQEVVKDDNQNQAVKAQPALFFCCQDWDTSLSPMLLKMRGKVGKFESDAF